MRELWPRALAALRRGVIREHPFVPSACPVCGKDAVYRSRPTSRLERLLLLVTPYRLYRCHECQERGWSLRRGPGERLERAKVVVAVARRRALRVARVGAVVAAVAAAAFGVVSGVGALARVVKSHAADWTLAMGRRTAEAAPAPASATSEQRPARKAAAAPARHAKASRAGSSKGTKVASASAPQPGRVAAGVAAAVPGAASTPGGRDRDHRSWRVAGGSWSRPRWGASVDEVLESARGEPRPVEGAAPPRRDRAGAPAIVQETTIAGRRVAVSYFFGEGGRLGSVRIAPAPESPDPVRAYDELAAWLAVANGPPASERREGELEGSWTRASTWATGDSRIDLRAWRTRLQDAHVLTLNLSDAVIEPVQARGVLLTYQPAGGSAGP